MSNPVKKLPIPISGLMLGAAALGSLCLAGYLSTFQNKSPVMVAVLLVLTIVNILIAHYIQFMYSAEVKMLFFSIHHNIPFHFKVDYHNRENYLLIREYL